MTSSKAFGQAAGPTMPSPRVLAVPADGLGPGPSGTAEALRWTGAGVAWTSDGAAVTGLVCGCSFSGHLAPAPAGTADEAAAVVPVAALAAAAAAGARFRERP